ncbi:transcriptional regulator [Streptomyces spongiicola]|uniref:Transcriptional regulator n=1 Tax=Streptomyces spongiicola TaxID=1690221 RepID=A0ABM6VBY5_9ACTN|nr:transcriptional regulator [Streptomyces spongiicola]
MGRVEADSRPEGLAEDGVTAALSTGAVARRLGVAPTTLRSWERRYAIGPATREDGRHRRWTPEDIALLEEMCRLTAQGVPPAEAARAAMSVSATVPRRGQSGETGRTGRTGETGRPGREAASPTRAPGGPNALPLGDVRQECRGLARAAVRLDAPAVDALLDAVIAEHGLVTAWEDVIAPTLHAVGRKWATSGERYIEVEHLLSWHVSSALRRVRPARVRPARVRERGRERADVPPVVLACVPGEQHSLPIEALAAALCERGVPARMFGAALPADALHEAVRRLGPAAVVLWAQSRSTADRSLVRIVSGVHWGVKGARKRTSLLLAGPGWAGGAYPGTVRLHGLGSAVDVIMALPRG